MGWVVRALLILIVLLSVGFGAWVIAIPIAAYLLLPTIFGRKPRMAVVVEGPSGKNLLGRIPKRVLLGGFLIVLSLLAFTNGGKWSPIVFAALGFLAISSKAVANSTWLSALEPVRGSILLKRSNLPFQWVAVSEVKLATKELARALTSVSDDLLIFAGEATAIYLVLKTFAPRAGLAESRILKRLERVNRMMAPRGAFVLPLDSEQGAQRLHVDLKPVKIETGDWPFSLESAAFEVLVLRSRNGFVEAVSAYAIEGGGQSMRVPTARQDLKIHPLMWETFDSLGKVLDWPDGDAMSSFLGGLFATRRDGIGEALQGAGAADGKSVIVRSLASPAVHLSRVQLRSLAKLYGYARQ